MGSITERIVYGERYDAIYVKTNKRFGVVEYLAKLVPHDGYKLYAVNADYRPAGRGVTWYYVIARNAREARTIFNRCVSWLNIFTVQEVTNHAYGQKILSSPSKFMVF